MVPNPSVWVVQFKHEVWDKTKKRDLNYTSKIGKMKSFLLKFSKETEGTFIPREITHIVSLFTLRGN